MGSPILTMPSGELTSEIRGTWWLVSRQDWTNDGQKKIDPVLGENPLGILCYAGNHFAAQFMKRDRTISVDGDLPKAGENNTLAVNGYDAYFGTYSVDEETGKVLHTLLGSITPANIGMTVSRNLRVNEDQLVIQLDTTTTVGEPIARTLTWKRLG